MEIWSIAPARDKIISRESVLCSRLFYNKVDDRSHLQLTVGGEMKLFSNKKLYVRSTHTQCQERLTICQFRKFQKKVNGRLKAATNFLHCNELLTLQRTSYERNPHPQPHDSCLRDTNGQHNCPRRHATQTKPSRSTHFHHPSSREDPRPPRRAEHDRPHTTPAVERHMGCRASHSDP